jgi:hypothetical protein
MFGFVGITHIEPGVAIFLRKTWIRGKKPALREGDT